jgi:hypothetical protein
MSLDAAHYDTVYQRIRQELQDLVICLQKNNCSKKQKAVLVGTIIGTWLFISGGSYLAYLTYKKNQLKHDHEAFIANDVEPFLKYMAKGVYPSEFANVSERERFQAINKFLKANKVPDDQKRVLLEKHFGQTLAKKIRKACGVRFASKDTFFTVSPRLRPKSET